MPRGGRRNEQAEARGKKVGRPALPEVAMERIYKDFSKDVQEFKASLQRGFAGGMAAIAEKFPQLVERLIAKAIDEDDLEAQKFLVERFLRTVQPESVGADSPAVAFLREWKQHLGKPAVVEGTGQSSPRVIETRPEPDGDGGTIFRPVPVEVGNGGGESGEVGAGRDIRGGEAP